MTTEDHEQLDRMRALAKRYPREFHDYAFLLRMMDERVTELLDANSRLVEERNTAQAEAKHHQDSVDFLLCHNGMAEMRRLDAENRTLAQEREDARHEQRTTWAQLQMYMDRAASAGEDRLISEAARTWAQSIHTLRRAQKPSADGKKGNLLGANHAYTSAHLALLALMPDTMNK